jgi:hypothetical protein
MMIKADRSFQRRFGETVVSVLFYAPGTGTSPLFGFCANIKERPAVFIEVMKSWDKGWRIVLTGDRALSILSELARDPLWNGGGE